jgi:hypothetical protein
MALLKRKAEKTTIISVRIPMSVKEQIDTLRKLADTKGFDLTGSLSEVVIKWTRQVSDELQEHEHDVHKTQVINGMDPECS